MFLMTGATGNVGAELIRILAAGGDRVRALTRSPGDKVFPPGVEPVAGDLNAPATLHPALEARAEMSQSTPAQYVDAFFRFYVDGTLDESRVLPTVRDVTGRPPRSFAQWAAAHAADFR